MVVSVAPSSDDPTVFAKDTVIDPWGNGTKTNSAGAFSSCYTIPGIAETMEGINDLFYEDSDPDWNSDNPELGRMFYCSPPSRRSDSSTTQSSITRRPKDVLLPKRALLPIREEEEISKDDISNGKSAFKIMLKLTPTAGQQEAGKKHASRGQATRMGQDSNSNPKTGKPTPDSNGNLSPADVRNDDGSASFRSGKSERASASSKRPVPATNPSSRARRGEALNTSDKESNLGDEASRASRDNKVSSSALVRSVRSQRERSSPRSVKSGRTSRSSSRSKKQLSNSTVGALINGDSLSLDSIRSAEEDLRSVGGKTTASMLPVVDEMGYSFSDDKSGVQFSAPSASGKDITDNADKTKEPEDYLSSTTSDCLKGSRNITLRSDGLQKELKRKDNLTGSVSSRSGRSKSSTKLGRVATHLFGKQLRLDRKSASGPSEHTTSIISTFDESKLRLLSSGSLGQEMEYDIQSEDGRQDCPSVTTGIIDSRDDVTPLVTMTQEVDNNDSSLRRRSLQLEPAEPQDAVSGSRSGVQSSGGAKSRSKFLLGVAEQQLVDDLSLGFNSTFTSIYSGQFRVPESKDQNKPLREDDESLCGMSSISNSSDFIEKCSLSVDESEFRLMITPSVSDEEKQQAEF